MNKVKLFKMDSDKHWEETGNGTAKIDIFNLIIEDDQDQRILLESDIQETLYTRQCGTLLQCIGNDHHIISFDNSSELNNIWRELSKIQGYPDRALPYPSASTISAIHSALDSPNILDVINLENHEDFIFNLCKEFLSATENLNIFFEVFKLLMNTCEEKIIKELLCKNNFSALLKALEMDPELKPHRNLSSDVNASVFNNVLNITDEQFIELIQLNFRIRVFKDALLTKTFDERLVIILNSFQIFINEEMVKYFCSSSEIRSGLIEKIKKTEFNALMFLNDLLLVSKSIMAPSIRYNLYQLLDEDEILSCFPLYWNNEEFSFKDKIKSNQIIMKAVYDMFSVIPWSVKTIFLYTNPDRVSFFEKGVGGGY